MRIKSEKFIKYCSVEYETLFINNTVRASSQESEVTVESAAQSCIHPTFNNLSINRLHMIK